MGFESSIFIVIAAVLIVNALRIGPKQTSAQEFEEIYDEEGIFTFTDSGFTVEAAGSIKEVEWSEVRSMIGYKEDLLTIDSICLDVICENDFSFQINEETSGWYRFLNESKAALTSIDTFWENAIALPTFETKLTLIYDRDNRSLKEVLKEVGKG